MTICNITVGADFAMMSCDTLATDTQSSSPVGFASKVEAVPHLNALVGGTGQWEAVREFGALIRHTFSCDARQALEEAPPTCQAIARHFPGKRFRIVLAAFLSGEKRVLCRAFDSETNFTPVEIAAAHAYSPDPDSKDREYRTLAELSAVATQGIGAEEFHRRLAENQHRAWRAGKVDVPGFAIGGQLVLHQLDKDGITIKPLTTFPEV